MEVAIDGNRISVKGPRGQLKRDFSPEMIIDLSNGILQVSRPSDSATHRSMHGLTRTLLANMVTGVSEGFQKRLEIVGVGYRASLKGKDLEILVGYSHPVLINPPEDIEFEVPVPTQVVVKGISKEQVGRMAADIRAIRSPEPYKGKGIRYANEVVRRKVGKRA